jgi:hypothetical protein
MRIINLEINELPPRILLEFIRNNPLSNLSQASSQGKLRIYTTIADDIAISDLYPSQTWASFHIGEPYSVHKCYWYSDAIDSNKLIWNRLVSKGLSVGVVGSIHSSKVPNNLHCNPLYRFFIPDSFSATTETKPCEYSAFQSLNLAIVSSSARSISLSTLLFSLGSKLNIFSLNLNKMGLSWFSIKWLFSIFIAFIKTGSPEVFRIAQYPLMFSIWHNLNLDYKPDYSALFTNHLAGNMHRYWFATFPFDFQGRDCYSKAWIKRHRDLINLSMQIIDSSVGQVLQNIDPDVTILISSSMGQGPTPGFGNDGDLANFDGKITNPRVFIKKFRQYLNQHGYDFCKCEILRNMAPQYGFRITPMPDATMFTSEYALHLKSFVQSLGLSCRSDLEGDSLVLTIDPYKDTLFQKSFTLKEARKALSDYGFTFFPINDHHSGSHDQHGVLAIINPTVPLLAALDQNSESGNINYLNISSIIEDLLLDNRLSSLC